MKATRLIAGGFTSALVTAGAVLALGAGPASAATCTASNPPGGTSCPVTVQVEVASATSITLPSPAVVDFGTINPANPGALLTSPAFTYTGTTNNPTGLSVTVTPPSDDLFHGTGSNAVTISTARLQVKGTGPIITLGGGGMVVDTANAPGVNIPFSDVFTLDPSGLTLPADTYSAVLAYSVAANS